ncbi:MAG: glycosyltransferase family 1 protein, partial [Candidatus Omnitrophica bacterium]|nr:glycosyltransferase family 1 protein [Candidatus Omnitrophota bacterium]
MRRLKVLISAYACNPLATEASYPGEAILGWNLVKQISKRHDIWVFTRIYNRDAIEEEINKGNISNANFIYIDFPRPFSLLLKNFIGFRLYYLFWQMKTYFVAKQLQARLKFDLFHQITFNNDWMPSFIGAFLNLPFIWGPVGGGQKTP